MEGQVFAIFVTYLSYLCVFGWAAGEICFSDFFFRLLNKAAEFVVGGYLETLSDMDAFFARQPGPLARYEILFMPRMNRFLSPRAPSALLMLWLDKFNCILPRQGEALESLVGAKKI